MSPPVGVAVVVSEPFGGRRGAGLGAWAGCSTTVVAIVESAVSWLRSRTVSDVTVDYAQRAGPWRRRRFLAVDTAWWSSRRVAIALSVVVVLVFLPAAMLVADHPFLLRRNIEQGDVFIYSIFAVPVLGVLGLFWLSLVVMALARRARWTWWIVAPVVSVLASTAVVLFFPTPGFTESRDEMDALVAQIRADPPERGFQSYDPPRQVGAVEIRSVDARTPGEVRVSDADTSFFQVSGWIYRDGNGAPATPGEGRESDTLEHIDDSWWKYSYTW